MYLNRLQKISCFMPFNPEEYKIWFKASKQGLKMKSLRFWVRSVEFCCKCLFNKWSTTAAKILHWTLEEFKVYVWSKESSTNCSGQHWCFSAVIENNNFSLDFWCCDHKELWGWIVISPSWKDGLVFPLLKERKDCKPTFLFELININ